MAETTTITAEDVALEFVATKLALVHIFEDLGGTSPAGPDELHQWAVHSPAPLPLGQDGLFERAVAERLYARVDEIQVAMMRAVGDWFHTTATQVEEMRSEWIEEGRDG